MQFAEKADKVCMAEFLLRKRNNQCKVTLGHTISVTTKYVFLDENSFSHIHEPMLPHSNDSQRTEVESGTCINFAMNVRIREKASINSITEDTLGILVARELSRSLRHAATSSSAAMLRVEGRQNTTDWKMGSVTQLAIKKATRVSMRKRPSALLILCVAAKALR